jgi:WD40 repeat protein/serine/threonine protein kinase
MSAHPDHDLLLRWLEGRLKQQDAELVTDHINQCAGECREFLDRLSSVERPDGEENQQFVTESTSPLLPGTRIRGYEIEELIARGGMGVVYRAWSSALQRPVALKLLAGGAQHDPIRRSRFCREVKAAGSLGHPNIIIVHDAEIWEDTPYLAMELAAGGSLEEFLGGAHLDARSAAELTQILALAVQRMHEAGIYHRDLKPQNVLLCLSDGARANPQPEPWEISLQGRLFAPKIGDFGLVKFIDEEDPRGGPSLTTLHGGLGTLCYAPPEQIIGDSARIDSRADVYGLGGVLYRLLTGRPPLVGGRRPQMIGSVLRAEPVSPRQIDSAIPQTLETICRKCLEKEPDRRYATAAELAADLKRFLNNQPIRARSSGWIGSISKGVRRHPLLVSATCALAFFCLLFGVLAAMYAIQRSTEQESARKEEISKNQELAIRQHQQDHDRSLRLLREAQSSIEDGESQAALELLMSVPRSERGWAWRHLRQSYAGCLFSLVGHEESVTGVVFSPDGTKIISSSKDKTVRIWDARTGIELMVLHGHADRVLGVAVSPDGNSIASAGADASVRIWNAKTGGLIRKIQVPESIVTCVAFSQDSHMVACGTRNPGAVHLWKLTDGVESFQIVCDPAAVKDVMFGLDNQVLVGLVRGEEGGRLIAWKTRDGQRHFDVHLNWMQVLKIQPGPDAASFWLISLGWCGQARNWTDGLEAPGRNETGGFPLSHHGDWFTSASKPNSIALWKQGALSSTGRPSSVLTHPQDITCIGVSPDDTLIATGSSDRSIRIWDLGRGRFAGQLQLPGSSDIKTGLGFSPDGANIAVLSRSGQLDTWSASTGLHNFASDGKAGGASDLVYSPDGEQIVAGSDSFMFVWDSHTGRVLAMEPIPCRPEALSFSLDGVKLASLHRGRIRIWDRKNQSVDWLESKTGKFSGIAFNPNSGELLSADEKGVLRLWNTILRSEIRSHESPFAAPGSLCYVPDGRALAGHTGPFVLVFRLGSSKEWMELRGHQTNINKVGWLAHGKTLVSVSDDRSVRVWDPAAGELQVQFRCSTRIASLAVDSLRDSFATCGDDGSCRVWMGSSETSVVEIYAHQGLVNGIALSADGELLASGGEDGTIRTWDTHTGDLIQVNRFNHSVLEVQLTHDGAVDSTSLAELNAAKAKKSAVEYRRSHIVRSANGQISAQFNGDLIRIFRIPSRQELDFRRWMTRPDPVWHSERSQRFRKEGNQSAADFHRKAGKRAEAMVAQDQLNAQH